MDYREQFEKNLEQARAFFGDLLDRPVETWPPSGTIIVPMPEDDPELRAANADLFERYGAAGQRPTVDPASSNAGTGTGTSIVAPAQRTSGFLSTAEQIAKAMPTPSYEALLGEVGKGFSARTLGTSGAADIFSMTGPSMDFTALCGQMKPSAILGDLEILKAAASMSQLQLRGLDSVQAQIQDMMTGMRDAYAIPRTQLGAIMSPLQESLQESLQARFSEMQACVSCFDMTGVRSLAESLAAFRDESPATFRMPIASACEAFFDAQARGLLDMSGDEFVERYQAGELPTEDDPDEQKKVTALREMMPVLRKAA